jgi:hypothetical protein
MKEEDAKLLYCGNLVAKVMDDGNKYQKRKATFKWLAPAMHQVSHME